MTSSTFVISGLVAFCAFTWGAHVAVQRKQVMQGVAAVALFSSAALFVLVATVGRVLLAALAVALFVSAVFVTVRPIFVSSRAAFGQMHLIAMLLDWSAFMFVAAFLQAFDLLSRQLLPQLAAATVSDSSTSESSTQSSVEATTTAPLKAAGAGSRGKPLDSPKTNEPLQKPTRPADTVVRDIPDHWTA